MDTLLLPHAIAKDLKLDPPLSLSVPVPLAQNSRHGLPQKDLFLAATQAVHTGAQDAPQGPTWGGAIRKAGTAYSGPNPRQWQGSKATPTGGGLPRSWVGAPGNICICAGLASLSRGSS